MGGGEAPPVPTPAVLPTVAEEPNLVVTSTVPLTQPLVITRPTPVESRPLGGFGPLVAAFAVLAFILALAARLVWLAGRP
jgi:hypothetical protein